MSVPLAYLPMEVRSKIYNRCEHCDLKNLQLCSKQFDEEVAPFLWKQLRPKVGYLDDNRLLNEQVRNLKHATVLSFHSGYNPPPTVTDNRDFNFDCILQHCDNAQLHSFYSYGFMTPTGPDLLAELIPELEVLYLSNVTAVNWQALSRLRNMVSLRIWNINVTDADMENINYVGLQKLSVSCCFGLTSKSLVYFGKAVNITNFALRIHPNDNEKYTADDLSEMLINFNDLEVLKLAGSPVDHTSFSCDEDSLPMFPHLEHLEMGTMSGGCNLTDDALAGVSFHNTLKHLNMKVGENISHAGVSHLESLQNLEYLDLHIESVNLGALPFSNMLRLRHLQLTGPGLSDENLLLISSLISLQRLEFGHIEKTAIGDHGMVSISKLPNLKYLDINECGNVTDCGIWALICLASLEHLEIVDNPKLTNKSLEAISMMTNLKVLEMNYCDSLTNAGLHHLSKLKYLTDLSLNGIDRITKTGLQNAGLGKFCEGHEK